MLFTGHARYRRRNLSADLFKPGQRLLGLDLGTKTIGWPLPTRAIKSPPRYDTIKRTKFGADAAQLEAVIDAENIGGLVLGLPLNMDGSAGPRVQATHAFIRNLARASFPTCRCCYGMSVCRPPLSNARSLTPTPAAPNAARSSTKWQRHLSYKARWTDCTPEPEQIHLPRLGSAPIQSGFNDFVGIKFHLPVPRLLGIEGLSASDITNLLDLADTYVDLNRQIDKKTDVCAVAPRLICFLKVQPARKAL